MKRARDQDLDDEDRCSYSRCNRPVEVISQRRPLCEYHYALEIEKEKEAFLKAMLEEVGQE